MLSSDPKYIFSINLPKARYTAVMNSSAFGPSLWQGMFFVAAGYDVNETPKAIKDSKYKQYFKSIGDVLPCRYCRESYEKFYDSMDIQKYMDLPSCGLIRFVYDLKNLVNTKLVTQENQALDKEYRKLLETYAPSDPAVAVAMKAAKERICYTKPAPPFEDVVANLLKHRVGCSAELKTCRAPLAKDTNSFPSPPSMPDLVTNATSDATLYRKTAVAAGGDGRNISQRRSRSRSRRRSSRRRLRRSSRYRKRR